MIATAKPGRIIQEGYQPFSPCVCRGTFFVNDRCVSCRGIWQGRSSVRYDNNTVADEGLGELRVSHLQQRLEQNAREYNRLIAELEKIAAGRIPRKDRGLFTKRVLDKVEERFPTTRRQRRHRKQRKQRR